MKSLYFLFFILFSVLNYSQNTVGTITNTNGSYNGLTVFSPSNSTETYLINNCGEVINQWSSTFTPGASVYLLENGNLLRTGKIANSEITFGGVGGKIELFDWDNNLLWEYTYSSPTVSQNHDIYPLPNGNILMLAVSTLSQSEAVQAGRNPTLLTEGKLFNGQILELEPVGTNQATIVWEWHIKDHLVQDFDASKDNYGIIGDNPNLLDVNYLNENNPEANWLHINSIQYNEDLDQIILSSRRLSEVYIIDHSTTTLESSSHSGGIYGKGGDFLFRWGNPESYDKGTAADQTLFSQHYPHWIPNGLTDAGKIMVFNNGNSLGYSTVDIFNPTQTAPGIYVYNATTGFGPSSVEWSYQDPVPTDFFSAILSSGQRLPNGNTLICDGDSGYFFEITPSNDIVWEYVNPDATNGILTQGDTPASNLVFRALKLPYDYPAFIDKDLTPSNPIELNPDLSECTLLSVNDFIAFKPRVYPNPTSGLITIDLNSTIDKIEVYDVLGKLVNVKLHTNQINLQSMVNGIYVLRIYSNDAVINKKIIKG